MNSIEEQLNSLIPKETQYRSFFSMMVLPLDSKRLSRQHEAILKWIDLSDREFEEFKVQVEKNRNPAWEEHGYDPLEDELFLLLETERIMWANFAVSIASTVEGLFGSICRLYEIPLPNKPNWSHKKNAIETYLGFSVESLTGFCNVTLARLLANCLKHNDQRVSVELSKKSPDRFPLDSANPEYFPEIEYEKEQWKTILDDTKSFMTALIDRLDDPVLTQERRDGS